MADYIGATPQSNPLMGLLAERLKQAQQFAAKPFGYQNPPAEMLMNLLGIPAVQQTAERIAYGEPLTTGRGMTTQVRPEVMEAAMTVAPVAGLLGRGTERAAMAAGRAGERYAEKVVPQIMEQGGLPAQLLSDLSQGSVSRVVPESSLLGQSKAAFTYPQEEAMRLAQQRAALPKEQFGLGLPPNNTAQQRADAMEYINRMFHETEGKNIENGLLNFDVKRVGAAASDEQTPYAMFLKPHGENIGIARNNPTQMPVLVKSNLTDENIMQAFGSREELQNYLNQFPDIKEATKAVRDLDKQMANYMGDIEKKADALYAQGKTEEGDKLLDSLNFNSNLMKEFDARTNELAALSKEKITDLFKSKGIGTVGLTNDKGAFGRSTLTEMVLNPSENVRSVNAAFDPFRRTAATAAAMGVAAPDLLAEEQKPKKKKSLLD